MPVPAIDLIASSGGRVFAKEQGQDRFYFATLDEMYIHARSGANESTVPSTYFKIDPEFNQAGATSRDLLAQLTGDLAGHPAGERFTGFRLALDSGLLGGMVVRFDRCKWYLLDARPPMELEFVADPGPEVPPWAPSYQHVRYCANDASTPDVWRPSVDYVRVLDIGVGHVHHHDQYQSITGGELQPLRATAATLLNAWSILPKWTLPLLWGFLMPRAANIFPWNERKTYADGYRLFNGPVRDGDGFVDGTANYYVLVQLKRDEVITDDPQTRRDAYAILFVDEQSLFSRRWRLAHPDDYKNVMFALVKDLDADTRRPPESKIYGWNPEKYWCPFRAGHIGPRSRMAVAAQVLLVNGEDASGTAVLYSINFSFASIDRSWRWRNLPAPAWYFDGESLWRPRAVTIGGDERVPDGPDACVYPQTIRLREDMTVCLKGRGTGSDGRTVVGCWYQRYLPATNQLVPLASELVAGQRPTQRYDHAWKFLPEVVFNRAEQFSHFGVYHQVDSRAQYYLLTPASDADAQVLAGRPGPWVDEQTQLFIDAMKFPWDSLRIKPLDPFTAVHRILLLADLFEHPFHWAPLPEGQRFASLFEPPVRLRIVKRGVRWIAMHWDKRDEDLLPYQGLPKTIELKNGERRVQVRLLLNKWLERPPIVPVAYVWWESADTLALAFMTPVTEEVLDNVARVRMAAFVDPNQSGDLVSLLDVETAGNFVYVAEGTYKYRVTLAAAEQQKLRNYASPTGALRFGTSLWFEDIVGHVAVPQEIRWLQSPMVRVTATRLAMPLGVPVDFTVHAEDPVTSAPRAGTVKVDGIAIGNTGTAFTYTFNNRVVEEIDPETKKVIRTEYPPSATVMVSGYAETAIRFTFYVSRATYVRQSVPPTMVAGRRYRVSVTMRNTGTGTWVREGSTPFRLGSQNPQDNTRWGLGRCELSGPVAPNQEANFGFEVTAPAAGSHHFQWRMLEELVQWFGGFSQDVVVQVSAPQMRTSVQPSPIPAGRQVDTIVTAYDTESGASVAGTVKIAGYEPKPTGTAIRVYFVSSPPAGVVSAPGYPDAQIAWPPLTTYSAGFRGATIGIGGNQL